MANPNSEGGNKSGSQLLPVPVKPPPSIAPLYHVILHNDDTHTFNYVIHMLMTLFGKTKEQSNEHANEVNTIGVTILETTHLERAELKRDQIRAFGKDPMLADSTGSMSASIEPAR